MVYITINILLAAIPSLAFLLFFYFQDKQRREPPLLIFRAFLLGFFAVIPALLLEIIIAGTADPFFTGIGRLLLRAFIIAALVEEGMKLVTVRLFLYNLKAFDEITDGIVYTIAASLGFAFFENVLYSFGPPLVLIIRGLTAVPIHAASAGILGYYIGITRMTETKQIGRGLLYAVLLHGAYDFLLFTQTLFSLLVLPLLVFAMIILRRLFKKAMATDKREFFR